MADEISNAELARRFDAFSQRVDKNLAEIIRRLDAYVLREVYQSELGRTGDRIGVAEQRLAAVEQSIKESETQRKGDRKWLIGTVVLPTVMALAAMALALWGP